MTAPVSKMRIRNLSSEGIILTLGTDRLHFEPARKPATVQWALKRAGHRHIELGRPFEILQVPIFEEIATLHGIPDPEPHTIYIVDHHVFSNCERPDVFTYNDDEEDGHGNVVISYLIGGKS